MSLQAQILSFVERVAEKFAGVDARIGGIDQLDTLDKSNLVTAINELAARGNGGSTTGGVAYTHLQSLPNTVWTINHNLGMRPAVTILDTGGNEDSIIYATTADVAKLAGSKRGADVVEYSVNAMGDELNDIVNNINRSADKNPNSAVKAQTVTRITSSDTRIIAMLQTLFWIVSLVVLVLTLVGVGTTISSIVSQRRNEIGLRKALGADSRAIGVEFYVESGIYGLIGGLLGTAIGYVLARVLCSTVFGRALGLNWLLCVGSLLLSVAIAVIASIPPVRRATRIDPAIVLREE